MKHCAWLLALALVSCSERAEPRPLPTTVVDSIHPVDEEIRRFKAELTGPAPVALAGGASTIDALVVRFVSALQQHDTAGIGGLALTSWEFIELYYPTSQYTRPPYRQSPGLLWFLIQQNSQKGLTRTLARLGGRDLGYRGVECPTAPHIPGENRLWQGCVVRLDAEGSADRVRLFGTILERAGQYKFISYANDF